MSQAAPVPADEAYVDTLRRRLSVALLGLGVLGGVGYVFAPTDWVGNVGYLLVAAVGVTMSVLGAVFARGARRRVWIALAAGQLLYLGGDILWVIYDFVLHIAPYPSAADALYLARYPVVALGLIWLIRGRRHGRDRAAFLDAAIISTGFAVLGAVFVVIPVAQGGGETVFSQVLAAAYPVGDLILFAALVRLFTGGVARSLSFWSLSTALALLLLIDVQYLLSVAGGVEYPAWLDIIYLIVYLLIGFSALHPSVDQLADPTPARPERMTPARLALLGVALALAPITDQLEHLTGHSGGSFVITIGGLVGVALVLVRISGLLRVLHAQTVQLSTQARHDSLTGVGNRRTWDHELSRAFAAVRAHDWPLVVAVLDFDHFKEFNDTHGHVMGDQVLRETTLAWSGLLGGRAFLARYGGEEFTVLLPNTRELAAEALLEELRAVVVRGQTCSIGMASWDGRESQDELFNRADEALHHAKRTGRNRIAVHDGVRIRDSAQWTSTNRAMLTGLATPEPATTEPATLEPATTEPATTEPATTEPLRTVG